MKVNTPLLSVGQAVDQGCVAVFTKEKVLICDKTKIGIKLTSPPLVKDKRGWKVYCDNSAYTRDMAQDLAMYLHACTGYHVLITWIRAITKGNNSSWPNLSAATGPKWIRKHLPRSIETTMGHMKAICSGTRSTKSKNKSSQPVTVEHVDDSDDEEPELEVP